MTEKEYRKKTRVTPAMRADRERVMLEFAKHQDISLRDRFAGQALSGIIEQEFTSTRVLKDWEGLYDRIAAGCYQLADAMIKERNKTNENEK